MNTRNATTVPSIINRKMFFLLSMIVIQGLLFIGFLYQPPAWAVGSDKIARIYDGTILLSDKTVSNTDLIYPILVIDQNFYFPLTWDLSRNIGVTTEYNPETGLNINTENPFMPFNPRCLGPNANIDNIRIARHKITVNDKLIASNLPVYMVDNITYVCLDKTSDFHINSTDLLFKGLNPDSQTALPSKYSTFDKLNIHDFVRNQGSTQLCWAYAANSMVEIKAALKKGIIIDLPEDHMIEHCPIPSNVTSGGNWQGSSIYLIEGLGKIKVTKTKEIQGTESMKRAIMDHGSVLTSIYYGIQRDKYYNEKNLAYYYNGESLSTHELILIGWDDNFSKDFFKKTPNGHLPKADGAFLAMNSFGTHFGDNGLFYISYEDVLIQNPAQAIEDYTIASPKEKVLKLDVSGVTHYETYKSKKVLFATTKFNLPEDLERNKELNSSVEIDPTPGVNVPSDQSTPAETTSTIEINKAKQEIPYESKTLNSIGIFTAAPETTVHLYYSEIFPENFTDLKYLTSCYSDIKGYQLVPLPKKIQLPREFYITLKYDSSVPFSIPIEADYPGIKYQVNPKEGACSLAYSFNTKLFHTPLEQIKDRSSIVLRLFVE